MKSALCDRYGNALTTSSTTARDHYVQALDLLLAAEARPVEAFENCVAADPGFALGHAGLARARHMTGDAGGARKALARAQRLSDGLGPREAAHVEALSLLIASKPAAALQAIRAHLSQHPRDALLAQACTGVFGLIGFSGLPGREAEQLALTTTLLPHYGDDWWFLGQHAFAQCETGQIDPADATVERALALNPRNANAAHIRAHVWYEAGDSAAGTAYLEDWLPGYDRAGMLHGHLSWHAALWALGDGDTAGMWRRIDADIAPGVAQGLALNVLTDMASILYRAELAGEKVAPERWTQVSDYAQRFFAEPGLGFADVHAALAHAMAGRTEALEKIIKAPAGPAADLVGALARGFREIAAQHWENAAQHFTSAMADHARLGGSRAQRDMLEFALLSALLKLGRADEAQRILALRRPVHDLETVALRRNSRMSRQITLA